MAARKPRPPARLECASILERYAALNGAEVALVKHDGWFCVELITPAADGTFRRDKLSGLFPKRRAIERRLMDFLAGVVVAQRVVAA